MSSLPDAPDASWSSQRVMESLKASIGDAAHTEACLAALISLTGGFGLKAEREKVLKALNVDYDVRCKELVDGDVLPLLISTWTIHSSTSPKILDYGLTCIRNISASAEQNTAVLLWGAVPMIVTTLKKFASSPAACESACKALSGVAYTTAGGEASMAAGAIPLVLASLKANWETSESLCWHTFWALHNLAVSPKGEGACTSGGAVPLLVSILLRYKESHHVAEWGCRLLCALAHSQAGQLVCAEAIPAVIETLGYQLKRGRSSDSSNNSNSSGSSTTSIGSTTTSSSSSSSSGSSDSSKGPQMHVTMLEYACWALENIGWTHTASKAAIISGGAVPLLLSVIGQLGATKTPRKHAASALGRLGDSDALIKLLSDAVAKVDLQEQGQAAFKGVSTPTAATTTTSSSSGSGISSSDTANFLFPYPTPQLITPPKETSYFAPQLITPPKDTSFFAKALAVSSLPSPTSSSSSSFSNFVFPTMKSESEGKAPALSLFPNIGGVPPQPSPSSLVWGVTPPKIKTGTTDANLPTKAGGVADTSSSISLSSSSSSTLSPLLSPFSSSAASAATSASANSSSPTTSGWGEVPLSTMAPRYLVEHLAAHLLREDAVIATLQALIAVSGGLENLPKRKLAVSAKGAEYGKICKEAVEAGLVPALLKVFCIHAPTPLVLEQALLVVRNFCSHLPVLTAFTDAGLAAFVAFNLRQYTSNATIVEAACRAASNLSSNPAGATVCVSIGIVPLVADVLQTYSANAIVSERAIYCIHHVSAIVLAQAKINANPVIITHIINALKTHSSEASLVEAACIAIASLSANSSVLKDACISNGSFTAIIEARRLHPNSAEIAEQAAKAINNLSTTTTGQNAACASGAVVALCDIIRLHSNSLKVCEWASRAFANISVASIGQTTCVSMGVIPLLTHLLELHCRGGEQVCTYSAWAILNIAWSDEAHRAAVIAAGGVPALAAALALLQNGEGKTKALEAIRKLELGGGGRKFIGIAVDGMRKAIGATLSLSQSHKKKKAAAAQAAAAAAAAAAVCNPASGKSPFSPFLLGNSPASPTTATATTAAALPSFVFPTPSSPSSLNGVGGISINGVSLNSSAFNVFNTGGGGGGGGGKVDASSPFSTAFSVGTVKKASPQKSLKRSNSGPLGGGGKPVVSLADISLGTSPVALAGGGASAAATSTLSPVSPFGKLAQSLASSSSSSTGSDGAAPSTHTTGSAFSALQATASGAFASSSAPSSSASASASAASASSSAFSSSSSSSPSSTAASPNPSSTFSAAEAAASPSLFIKAARERIEDEKALREALIILVAISGGGVEDEEEEGEEEVKEAGVALEEGSTSSSAAPMTTKKTPAKATSQNLRLSDRIAALAAQAVDYSERCSELVKARALAFIVSVLAKQPTSARIVELAFTALRNICAGPETCKVATVASGSLLLLAANARNHDKSARVFQLACEVSAAVSFSEPLKEACLVFSIAEYPLTAALRTFGPEFPGVIEWACRGVWNLAGATSLSDAAATATATATAFPASPSSSSPLAPSTLIRKLPINLVLDVLGRYANSAAPSSSSSNSSFSSLSQAAESAAASAPAMVDAVEWAGRAIFKVATASAAGKEECLTSGAVSALISAHNALGSHLKARKVLFQSLASLGYTLGGAKIALT